MEEQIHPQTIEKEIDKEGDEFISSAATAEDLNILQEMMKAGLMYGHKKSKTDPRFRKYIYTTRNGIEIIELAETLKSIAAAAEFLKKIINNGGSALIVATQPALKEAVQNLAKQFNFSYINERWIGGLLTNFKVISKRIEYFKKIQDDFQKGLFEKYTKKERVMTNRNIERMRKMFTGLENLTKLPDALFLVDASIKSHKTAIREARRLKIKTAGIVDSDDNPDLLDYPIPANDHAKMSVEWIINKISQRLTANDQS